MFLNLNLPEILYGHDVNKDRRRFIFDPSVSESKFQSILILVFDGAGLLLSLPLAEFENTDYTK